MLKSCIELKHNCHETKKQQETLQTLLQEEFAINLNIFEAPLRTNGTFKIKKNTGVVDLLLLPRKLKK